MGNSKVEEALKMLEDGVGNVFQDQNYIDYLNTLEKFHQYSFSNVMLIFAQKPEATKVAGFRTWQKEFNRCVKKGEKAIRIIAPRTYKKEGKDGKEEERLYFTAVPVFDISQTEGDPLPTFKIERLSQDFEDYALMRDTLIKIAKIPVRFEKMETPTSNGYFDPVLNEIAISNTISEAQTIKTMIHEISHSRLHVNADKDRRTEEVEAESIAYVVFRHLGYDSSEYSFKYVANWSSGKDTKELKSSLDTISKTSKELIDSIEKELNKESK